MSTNAEFLEDNIEQETRAKLRESFLRGMLGLIGEPCKVLTYEQTTLSATFIGWKPDGSEMLLTDLETPSGTTVPAALLRSPDVLAIKFNKLM